MDKLNQKELDYILDEIPNKLNNFSHSSKVEKCADKIFYNYIFTKRYAQEYYEYFEKSLPGFLKTSYTNKLNDTEYLIQAQYCEEYAKKYPDIFKKQY